MMNKFEQLQHEENLNKRIRAMLVSFWVFIALTFVMVALYSQPAMAEALTPCVPGEVIADCDPPTFRDIEFTVATCITSAYALAGLIFGYYFVNNIVAPYFSMDPGKMGDAKKAFLPWLVGFLGFFLVNPLASNLMALFLDTESECYGALAAPGFAFFFPDVCTEGDKPTAKISGTVTLVGGAGVDNDATIFLIKVTDDGEINSKHVNTSDSEYSFTVEDSQEYNLVGCYEESGVEYTMTRGGIELDPGANRDIDLVLSEDSDGCPYD